MLVYFIFIFIIFLACVIGIVGFPGGEYLLRLSLASVVKMASVWCVVEEHRTAR